MKALAIHIEDIEKRIIFTIERCQSDEPVRDVACFYYIGMATKFQSQLWHCSGCVVLVDRRVSNGSNAKLQIRCANNYNENWQHFQYFPHCSVERGQIS